MPNKQTFAALLLCVPWSLCAQGAESAAEQPLIQPFKATYEVFRRGDSMGKGSRSLKPLSASSYEFRYDTQLSFLFLSDERHEISRLILANHRVMPYWYEFKREGTGPDRLNRLTFNALSGKVQNSAEQQPVEGIEWQSGMQDQLSYQLQMQLDLMQGKSELRYSAVNKKGEPREYAFAIEGNETVTVPMGTYQTVKVRRMTDHEDRVTYAWMAPELDYTLIRLQQSEDGEESYDVRLVDLTWTPVTLEPQ